METGRLLIIFLGMGAVTYLPRLLPLMALSQARLPGPFVSWLSYLPAAILAALIFPGVFMVNGRVEIGPGNPALWALLVSFAVAVRTRSLILTMVAGGAVMFAAGLLM